MNPFNYQRATAPDEAFHAVSAHGAKVLGGRTNLVDRLRYNVHQATRLIDVTHLNVTQITSTGNTTLIRPGVHNMLLARRETIRPPAARNAPPARRAHHRSRAPRAKIRQALLLPQGARAPELRLRPRLRCSRPRDQRQHHPVRRPRPRRSRPQPLAFSRSRKI